MPWWRELSEITPLDLRGQKVRVVTIAGNPWFATNDVCRAVGYALKTSGQVNTAHATRPLAADDKGSRLMNSLGWDAIHVHDLRKLP